MLNGTAPNPKKNWGRVNAPVDRMDRLVLTDTEDASLEHDDVNFVGKDGIFFSEEHKVAHHTHDPLHVNLDSGKITTAD